VGARIGQEEQLTAIETEHFAEPIYDLVGRIALARFEMTDIGSGGSDAACDFFLREVELAPTFANYLAETAFLGPWHYAVASHDERPAA
jgi:hypothetical protein